MREEILGQLEAGEAVPSRELTARLKAARLETRTTSEAEEAEAQTQTEPKSPAAAAIEAAKFILIRMPHADLEEMRYWVEKADPSVLRTNLVISRIWG